MPDSAPWMASLYFYATALLSTGGMSTSMVTTTALTRLRMWLLGPTAGVTWFVIAQPVLFIIYTCILHEVLPMAKDSFDSRSEAVNVILFYVLFSCLIVAMFPAGLVDLIAGFLFGVDIGLPTAIASKVSGSVLCFYISRHMCSECLRRQLVERYRWLGALYLMMGEKPWRTMTVLRFSALPAALKNYGSSTFGIHVSIYTVATTLSMSFESFLLVPVGHSANSWRQILTRKRSTVENLVLLSGLFLLVGLFAAIQRVVKSQIRRIEREAEANDVSVCSEGNALTGTEDQLGERDIAADSENASMGGANGLDDEDSVQPVDSPGDEESNLVQKGLI